MASVTSPVFAGDDGTFHYAECPAAQRTGECECTAQDDVREWLTERPGRLCGIEHPPRGYGADPTRVQPVGRTRSEREHLAAIEERIAWLADKGDGFAGRERTALQWALRRVADAERREREADGAVSPDACPLRGCVASRHDNDLHVARHADGRLVYLRERPASAQ
jgi:hypothetical protein